MAGWVPLGSPTVWGHLPAWGDPAMVTLPAHLRLYQWLQTRFLLPTRGKGEQGTSLAHCEAKLIKLFSAY